MEAEFACSRRGKVVGHARCEGCVGWVGWAGRGESHTVLYSAAQ